MRIVGGKYKGLNLREPASNSLVRPTTDRVREAVASVALSQFNLDLSHISVLDAFAGTGALGIEMLSRGARSLTFFEKDSSQIKLLKDNLSLLKERGNADIIKGDAACLAQIKNLPGSPFQLVLLDPPYALDPALSEGVLLNLMRSENLSAGCLAIHERAKKREPLFSETHNDWHLLKKKMIGTVAFEVLQWNNS